MADPVDTVEIEYGVRFLAPHRSAGEVIWLPGIEYAAIVAAELQGMAELMQREVGPWVPFKRAHARG